MSAVAVATQNEPRPATPEAAATAVAFHYTQTDSFPALLNQLGASLLVTTYQANSSMASEVNRRSF